MKKRQVALAAAICTALTSVGFVGNALAAEKNDDAENDENASDKEDTEKMSSCHFDQHQ